MRGSVVFSDAPNLLQMLGLLSAAVLCCGIGLFTIFADLDLLGSRRYDILAGGALCVIGTLCLLKLV